MKLLQRILNLKGNPEPPFGIQKPESLQYFLLECWNQYADLPETLVPYVDKIKTREEWEKLGFTFEFNKYGQIRKIKIDNRYYSFIRVSVNNPLEREAIKTGKRLTHNPSHIAILLERGCSPTEFLHSLNGDKA